MSLGEATPKFGLLSLLLFFSFCFFFPLFPPHWHEHILFPSLGDAGEWILVFQLSFEINVERSEMNTEAQQVICSTLCPAQIYSF